MIRHFFFQEKTLIKLSEKFLENNITVTFYGKEFWATTKFSENVKREASVTGMTPVQWIKKFSKGILKILAIDEIHKIRMIRSQINLEIPNDVQMSNTFDNYLEISPPRVHKCVFLPEFLKLYLSKKTNKKDLNILFFGDSENDILCAEIANATWTFKSSPENLKALSKGILSDENGEGVKKFFQRFIQIY